MILRKYFVTKSSGQSSEHIAMITVPIIIARVFSDDKLKRKLSTLVHYLQATIIFLIISNSKND